MATLQVRNFPDDVYARLQELADEQHTTVDATVLDAVERVIQSAEWRKRWETRESVDLGMDGASLVREARGELYDDHEEFA